LDARFGLPALDNSVLASTASYPNRLLMYLLLQQQMARQAAASAGVYAYQATASIVVSEQAFGRRSGQDLFRRGIDIVEADMRTVVPEAEAAITITAFQRDRRARARDARLDDEGRMSGVPVAGIDQCRHRHACGRRPGRAAGHPRA
jgi:hypothetical protein